MTTMSTENNCTKCNQAITGTDFVLCRGYCGCMSHMQCSGRTGVTRALMNYFTTHRKNLYWMCDNCAELFENSHLRSITKIADEKSPLMSLTEAISNLQTEIKQLSSKPVPPVLPPVPSAQSPALRRWPTIDPVRPAKRPRGLDLPQKAAECQSGSKQTGENVVSVPTCEIPADKFWLYLSRIRPNVSNEQILAMVRANIEMDTDPEVVKLVAKGVDTSNMTFISFKVGLDPALKAVALDPSTWPEGIMFREFEEYSTRKFRKPSVVALTPTSATPHADKMQQ